MKFENRGFICLVVIISFLGSLQGSDQTVQDSSKICKNTTNDAFVLISTLSSLTSAHEKYFQKNKTNAKIRCKTCTTKVLDLDEFEGGLIGFALKAVSDGADDFGKAKMFLDGWIKLLSNGASASEFVNFMIHTSNDMKQVCSHCHGVSWEKIAESHSK